MFTLNGAEYAATREVVCGSCFADGELDGSLLVEVKSAAGNKQRVFKRPAMGGVRALADPYFNLLHDSLEVAYYKHWKNGAAKEFCGFDKSPLVVDSKQTFDSLHAALWLLHIIATRKVNRSLPPEKAYIEKDWWCKCDDEGNVIKDLVEEAKANLQPLKEYATPLIDSLPDELITQSDIEWL